MMSSQPQPSTPAASAGQDNDRLPDRLCPQPSLRQKSSRPASGRGYRRIPPLPLRMLDDNASEIPKPLAPIQCDGTLSSCSGAPPTPLSPMAAALRESRKTQLNQQSPHSSNPPEFLQNLHSPRPPHVQPTRILSPAHSSCVSGSSVEIPHVGVADRSNKQPSFVTPPYSPLSLGSGVSAKHSLSTNTSTNKSSEAQLRRPVENNPFYERSKNTISISHTRPTASSDLSASAAATLHRSSASSTLDNMASTLTLTSQPLSSQVQSSSNSPFPSPFTVTPLVSSSHISSSRGSYHSSKGNVMSNVSVSRALTDRMATNMCGADAIATPVSQSIGSPSSSGTKSSGFHSLVHAQKIPWYSDTHGNEKINDSNAVAYQVKVRPETVGNGAIGAQRGRTRGRRKTRKKAVIIAISYQDNSSQGTALEYGYAAQKWYDILLRRLDFISDEIRLVTDTPPTLCGNTVCLPPTSAHIMSAMDWLTEDMIPGDRLFFAFNGEVVHHGSTDDPCDPPPQFIVPGDFPTGVVVWDENFHAMIRRVPDGVNMHMVFDCRRSWSIVRLPYIYVSVKMQHRGNFEFRTALTPDSWGTPEVATRASRTVMGFTRVRHEKEQRDVEKQRSYWQEQVSKYNDCASVVCFGASPTRNRKFSFRKLRINPLEKGEYSDVFVLAIDQILRHGRKLTYGSLMMEMAQHLSPSGELNQTPQICSTHELDLNAIILF